MQNIELLNSIARGTYSYYIYALKDENKICIFVWLQTNRLTDVTGFSKKQRGVPASIRDWTKGKAQ
jgi:hypothetical protein